ncbi:glycosyltransferase family A protein [Niabella sp.]|uniref:glycosyltransferase family 2 protein n=1 Tax=Niabella sp. TaxID=1962976 RepID=UPI0026065263|nr:glycosyltransferase family A protein [Niabella sp.]
MNYKTAVTVVMPCYNSENFVAKAIKSILSQSMGDFEFIIINDASQDNTRNIIKKYLYDSRINFIDLNKNVGNYTARNMGMKIAKSKYIAVMDSDDIADKNRLEIQYSYLEKHRKIGCIGSQGYIVDEDDNVIGPTNKPTIANVLKTCLLKNNFTIHPSLVYRTNLIKKHNLFYNECLTYSADYDFVVRASNKFKITNLEQRLILYRRHSKQISKAKSKEQAGFADKVRLSQLNSFELNYSEEEQRFFLKLMRDEQLTRNELQTCIILMNRLLEQNKRKKVYFNKHLYHFFNYCIEEALLTD